MEFLLGLLHIIVAVWAIISILQSSAPGTHKVLWALLVLVFPLIGLIVWFLIGPRASGS